tara:strand:+ start:224 stop:430 length:207 start_codon:yes stop_codon:yes gene_type:complete
MPTEPNERDAALVDLMARIKVVWVPNEGSRDPMQALAQFAVKLWLSQQERGNVQPPGPEQAEERRAAG